MKIKHILINTFMLLSCLFIIIGCRDTRSTGEKIEDSVEEVSEELEEGAEEVSDEVKDELDDASNN